MQSSGHKKKKFRELPEEEKKKLIESAKAKNPDGIIVVVEAHPLCKIFNDLPEYKYIVSRKDNIR